MSDEIVNLYDCDNCGFRYDPKDFDGPIKVASMDLLSVDQQSAEPSHRGTPLRDRVIRHRQSDKSVASHP